MKKLFWFILFISVFIQAQVINPIKWKSEIKYIQNNQYEAVFTATLESGWHLYSKDIKLENAIPTSFTYTENADIKLIGSTREIGKKIEEYSEVFGGNQVYYSDKAEYRQKFEITRNKPVKFEAEVEFQICNDRICLAPDGESFSFHVKPEAKSTEGTEVLIELAKDTITEQNTVDIDSVAISNSGGTTFHNQTLDKNQTIIPSLDINNPINKECGEKIIQDESNLWIFVFWFHRRIDSLVNPLCVSDDSFNNFLFYQACKK